MFSRHVCRRPILSLALLGALAGCGKSATGPSVRDLSGHWFGTTADSVFRFDLTFTDAAEQIHGSGVLSRSIDTVTLAVTITGTHTHPYFHLAMAASGSGFQPMSMDGQDTSTAVLVGAVMGSGFTGQQVVMSKQ